MYHPENPTWAPRRARPQQPHAKASKERPAIVNNIFRCYGRPCPLLSVTSSSRMWVYLLLFLHPSHSHALAPTPHLPNFSIFLCPLLLRAHRMSDNHKHPAAEQINGACAHAREYPSSASATGQVDHLISCIGTTSSWHKP